jgi:hypothetical protein
MMVRGRMAAPHVLITCLGAAAFVVLPAIVTARGTQSQDTKKMETHDDLLLRVERAAPGFGGMYVERDGRLAVYLTDGSQLPAARAAIVAVFGPAAIPAAGMRAVAGQYTLSQLAAWTKRASGVMELPGVVFVDLDEAKNRVAIGIDGRSRTEAVQKMLTSLEIPRGAVVVEITDPVEPLAPGELPDSR